MKTRTHWTSSALKEYETCPAKYRWNYLFDASDWLKLGFTIVPKKESFAMLRGTDIHQTCEDYLLDKIGVAQLHPEISEQWRNMLTTLRNVNAIAEQQWEFDEGWHPKGETDDLWLRMKIDAHHLTGKRGLRSKKKLARVIDYKTGKVYFDNKEQVELYAIGTFAKYDDVETVVTELWYFDQGDLIVDKTFKRDEVPTLARKWEQRANRLLSETKYPERKNKFCGWCPFSQTKGGPCRTA